MQGMCNYCYLASLTRVYVITVFALKPMCLATLLTNILDCGLLTSHAFLSSETLVLSCYQLWCWVSLQTMLRQTLVCVFKVTCPGSTLYGTVTFTLVDIGSSVDVQ